MSGALRKIAGNASKHNCTIIFLNQLRQKVGAPHPNAATPAPCWRSLLITAHCAWLKTMSHVSNQLAFAV